MKELTRQSRRHDSQVEAKPDTPLFYVLQTISRSSARGHLPP